MKLFGTLACGVAAVVEPAHVLDDPEVALRVVLHALVAAAADRARDVLDDRRVGQRRLVLGRAAVLGREDQPLRERIPGRAVDVGQRRAGVVGGGQQRHLVGAVGVQVDAGDACRACRPRAPGTGSACRSRTTRPGRSVRRAPGRCSCRARSSSPRPGGWRWADRPAPAAAARRRCSRRTPRWPSCRRPGSPSAGSRAGSSPAPPRSRSARAAAALGDEKPGFFGWAAGTGVMFSLPCRPTS